MRYPGEKGQLDVHAGPEPGAQVGGAGEDVPQALVPHELPSTLLNELLHLVDAWFICYMFVFSLSRVWDWEEHSYLLQSPAEPFKHSLHVSSFLHGYDPGVIFLIDPD